MELNLEVEEVLAQQAEIINLICLLLEDLLVILKRLPEIEAQKANEEIEGFLLAVDKANLETWQDRN